MDHHQSRRSFSPTPLQPSSVNGSEDSSAGPLGRDHSPPQQHSSRLMQSPRVHDANVGGGNSVQGLANVMSSPLSSRRFLPPVHLPTSQPQQYSAYMPSLEPTGGAKMLVDPLTGQHYYLPTAPPGPMMTAATAYYPLYATAPPPQPAMFIQHHHHQAQPFPPPGYALVATTQPQPMPPQSPTHHHHHAATPPQSYFHYPVHSYSAQPQSHYVESGPQHYQHYQHHHEAVGGEERSYYRVEVPPSSAASVCCEELAPPRQPPPLPPRDEEYQISALDRRLHLPATTYHHIDQTSSNRPWQALQAGAGGVESTSSSSTNTSGFLSNGSATMAGQVRAGQSHLRRSPQGDAKAQSPTPPAPAPQPPQPPPAVVQRPVRMDIDLNRPLTPPSPKVQLCSTPRKTPLAPPPTAFTISFGREETSNSGCGSPRKEPTLGATAQFSLQDAARQAPTGRRMLKKAEEALRQQQRARHEEKKISADTSSPKQYLFDKMLQGLDGGHSGSQHAPGIAGISVNERGEMSDVQSEAGTFIIERKTKTAKSTPSPMNRSRRTVEEEEEDEGESDARSTDSSTTATATTPSSSIRSSNRKSGGGSRTNRSKQIASKLPPLEGREQLTRGSSHAKQATVDTPKRSLMSDLRKLREERGSPRGAICINLGPLNRPQRPCQQLPRHQHQHQRPSTSGNNFNRGDGGRYSMRTGHPQSARLPPHPFSSASRLSADGRPPFRTGTGSGYAKPNKSRFHQEEQHEESPEMVAWLRRKEYDPRKSAAEARRLQQLKQREAFLSSRSVSYHNASSRNDGPTANDWKSNRREDRLMGDDWSNRSYDELSRLGEEESAGEEAFGSVTGENNALLKRTIDDLTEKCQRSIELLRLCNRNQLSESVENLLESVIVVEGEQNGEQGEAAPATKGGEGLAERLDKLNSAFDAIQKYLEDQSSGGGGRASTNASSLSPPLSQHSSGGLARPGDRAASLAPATTSTPHSSSTSRLLAGLCTATEGKSKTTGSDQEDRTF